MKKLSDNAVWCPVSPFAGRLAVRVSFPNFASLALSRLCDVRNGAPGWRKNHAYFQRIKVKQGKTRYFLYPRGPGRPRDVIFIASNATLPRSDAPHAPAVPFNLVIAQKPRVKCAMRKGTRPNKPDQASAPFGLIPVNLQECAAMPNNLIAPCECGFLEREANHPDSPIRFDSKLNEYHFIHRMSTGEEAKMMIYHCPSCGGRAPKSRRGELFRRLDHTEKRRLCKLTERLQTIQDVTSTLGEPDIRQPVGMVVTTPERDGEPETTRSYPVMIYTKLSETADIHVIVYPLDRVAISFRGKAVKKDAG